jgi:hypothetical protein
LVDAKEVFLRTAERFRRQAQGLQMPVELDRLFSPLVFLRSLAELRPVWKLEEPCLNRPVFCS